MRVVLIAVIAACGGTPIAPHAPAPARPPVKHAAAPRERIDVIATLEQPLGEAASVIPGPAQLVLGGPTLQALEGAPQLEVDVLEEQGNDVRVGVRLAHARFALWLQRTTMLAAITRDIRVDHPAAPVSLGAAAMEVVLHAGARVRRLARKGDRFEVRYVGAIEVQGWVPSDAVADRGATSHANHGRVPTGRRWLMVTPGSVIRTEPKWAGHQLAVVGQANFLDTIHEVDTSWVEVGYDDDDVTVHGYVSKHDPPARTHRRPAAQQTNALVPNATVDHACLYVADEPIGFIVETQQVLVEPGPRVGWSTLTIDTPWGPLPLDVKGSPDTGIAPCAP